ncbi:MAG: hypothetical protein H8E32_07845 [Nitrospinae bacterium]|nr:hypothetical protein [Nitrospinota bacterium]
MRDNEEISHTPSGHETSEGDITCCQLAIALWRVKVVSAQRTIAICLHG